MLVKSKHTQTCKETTSLKFPTAKRKKNEHDPEGSSAINLSRKQRGEQTGIGLSSTEEPTLDFRVNTGCTLYIVLYEH